MSRITLSKSAPPTLEVKPAPYHMAQRWISRHETKEARTWPNILMSQQAYQEVNRHAESQPDLEVGGMLIGDAYFTPDKELVVSVEAQIEARHVEHSAAHLTFTSRTLTNVLDQIDEKFPGKQIVGWYHTHPGLTIFLSSMDIWLHSNFFPQPWHVALVIDPYVHHGGFFYYPGGAMGFIHPKHYTGFYELLEPGSESIVNWYNLVPVTPRPEAVETREGYRHES